MLLPLIILQKPNTPIFKLIERHTLPYTHVDAFSKTRNYYTSLDSGPDQRVSQSGTSPHDKLGVQ